MSLLRDVLLNAEHRFDTWRRANKTYHRSIFVDTYEGHGRQGRVRLRGRVIANLPITSDPDQGVLWNMADMLRRYASDEVPDATLNFPDRPEQCTTNHEGYYSIELDWTPPQERSTSIWHELPIELVKPHGKTQDKSVFEAAFQYPDERSKIAVICDIDDTVIHTGARRLTSHAAAVLTNNPYTRRVFAGMPAFLEGLAHRGHKEPVHPLFYLSSSPWNLHGFFQKTFAAHGVPRGTYFLKDFGFERGYTLKSGHGEHKSEHARRLIKTYPDLTFVLIGDSGQEDMVIYERVIATCPDRVAACYIRDVTGYGRGKQIPEVLRRIQQEYGVPCVFSHDSVHMATHAHLNGLIGDDALARVERAARSDRFAQLEGALL